MSIYHPDPEFIIPSLSDIEKLNRAQMRVADHNSGGSYDMVAVSGSARLVGVNRLKRSAQTISPDYPEDFGVHAELDLYRKFCMNPSNPSSYSGTVYIAGKLNTSGSAMNNTMPCSYCVAILYECGISHAVFFHNGQPAKASLRSLNGI